ncbi:TcpQ domain-containing protein [Variovorax sp. ZS18.2.2]|uniref:PFGI-1 class ICE element type IV pilus protein PilL2 n=1 Tax=Variovorax sp. ZS18.2.2 TaxID=2971255 RepID=UPI0021519445|nr:TcpQ domain-containing protein [Variovorax sp. ZS18.2.2]MCR6481011.1 TcpQ domain-containing protein [Variovorax sp. ZS18.2.2]
MHLVHRHPILLAAGALLWGLVGPLWAQSQFDPIVVDGAAARPELRIGRYTTQSAEPAVDASDPLAVVAQISFPRATIRTIGDAVQHTLLRTGYTLADPTGLSPEASSFLNLSLPESQREIGPYRVRAILDVLLGSTWKWQLDPVRRRLWFTVDAAYADLLPPSTPISAKPVSSDAGEAMVTLEPVRSPSPQFQTEAIVPGSLPAKLSPATTVTTASGTAQAITAKAPAMPATAVVASPVVPPSTGRSAADSNTEPATSTVAPSNWTVADEPTLRDVVSRWASLGGIQLHWVSPRNLPIDTEIRGTYSGSFKQALVQLADKFGALEAPFGFRFLDNGTVLRVYDLADLTATGK